MAVDLVKNFGPISVLRRLTLVAKPGEVSVIFGPNGACKSALLRIIATLSRADDGKVNVNGFDSLRQGERVRQSTGVVLHSPMLYGDLTGLENLRFFARMFRLDNADQQISKISDQLRVTDILDQRIATLSHGMQKRIAIARALLHEPQVLLFDEPETGLDQQALHLFQNLLMEWRDEGRCVLMTTHNIERGLAVCDRVAILAGGRLEFERPRTELTESQLRQSYSELAGPSQ